MRSGPSTWRSWLAVGSIASASFAMVTTEFLPVGLLPEIAQDLQIAEGRAGWMVTLPGAVAALSAPLLAVLASQLDRRRMLVTLTVLIAVSNGVSAAAQGFGEMLFARFLLGLCVGGFWAFAVQSARQLVPEPDRVRATALVLGGISIGTVAGVPAGAWLGDGSGWRMAFAVIAALTALVAVLQIVLLPPIPTARAVRPVDLLRLLRGAVVRVGLVMVVLTITGHFATYTYLKPALQQVSGLSVSEVTALLLLYGIAGIGGNFFAESMARRSPRGGLALAAMLLAMPMLLMPMLGGGGAVPAAALVAVWGFAFGALLVGITDWMFKATPDTPEVGQALLVSVFQAALALGACTGGLLLDGQGVRSALVAGGGLALLGSLLALRTGTVGPDSDSHTRPALPG